MSLAVGVGVRPIWHRAASAQPPRGFKLI